MLVGSILIGALAGFALLNYVQGVENQALIDSEPVTVWVVAQDIEAGTTATDVLQTSRVVQREIDPAFRPATAIADTVQIEGRVAVNNLAANQILVQGMFDDPEVVQTTFADLVPADHVAISLDFATVRAAGGFIKPGDFVDMIVLGDPLPVIGEEDAFDTSASQTPYQRPARYLYRGVRVIAVNQAIVGQAVAEGETAAAGEGDGNSLQITMALPADAAQRILSVPENNMVLSLLPEDWTPEARPNIIVEDILIDAQLPAEDPTQLTPFGPEGFVDLFEEAVEQQNEELGIGGDAPAATPPGADDDAGDAGTGEG
jgi:Flp pilus assembly protein CpaB